MKKLLFFGMFLAVLITACNKDIDTFIPDGIVNINSSLRGIVIDENNNPVEGADVRIAGEVQVTDENGFFYFEGISVKEDRAYVQVAKSGFFHGSRAYYPSKDKESKVRIKLMSSDIVGNVNNSNGGSVSFAGCTLNFPSNCVATTSGTAYSGNIKVAAKFLDPTSNDLIERMPGDLTAIDLAGNERILKTYGMIAVELYGDNNELLQVAAGSTVEINIPVDASLAANAPSTIPLWHFDESQGIWKEEGNAQLQNNMYVGQVSHFSFWNCDAPFELVNLTGQLMFDDAPMAFTSIVVNVVNSAPNDWRGTGYGHTTKDGEFGGKMPAGEDLELCILDECGGYSGCMPLGNFTSDQDLGQIVINSISTPRSVLVSGKALDCNDQPVTDGYVKLSTRGAYDIVTIDPTDGSFESLITYCETSAELEVILIDNGENKQSAPANYPLGNSSTLDVGEVTVCEELAQFFRFELDNIIYTLDQTFFNVPTSTTADSTFIMAYISGGLEQTLFNLDFNPDVELGVGTSNNHSGNLYIQGEFSPITITGFCSDLTVNMSTYSDVIGEYVEGTFEGLFDINTNNNGQTVTEQKTITGEFKSPVIE